MNKLALSRPLTALSACTLLLLAACGGGGGGGDSAPSPTPEIRPTRASGLVLCAITARAQVPRR